MDKAPQPAPQEGKKSEGIVDLNSAQKLKDFIRLAIESGYSPAQTGELFQHSDDPTIREAGKLLQEGSDETPAKE